MKYLNQTQREQLANFFEGIVIEANRAKVILDTGNNVTYIRMCEIAKVILMDMDNITRTLKTIQRLQDE